VRVLLLSAYDALSHRYWREGLVSHFDRVDWTVLSLAPRHFSYRVGANPLSFLSLYQPQLSQHYDLIIATSLVDMARLRGLVPSLADTPLWLYCHENQFAYPRSPQQHGGEKLDLQLIMPFLYSCLAADKISFNSGWNRRSTLQGIASLVESLPESLVWVADTIEQRSDVLPVPLSPLSPRALLSSVAEEVGSDRCTTLLWNHRWEYDKGPEHLLALVEALSAAEYPCRLHIVGQQFRRVPAAFDRIAKCLQQSPSLQLGQWGYLESTAQYHALLRDSDIVLSTARHDFQGIAVLEAVQAGCIPLLPAYLVYPELFSADYLYDVGDDPAQCAAHILEKLQHWRQVGLPPRVDITGLSWDALRPDYARRLTALARRQQAQFIAKD